jgi:hypothetical protein
MLWVTPNCRRWGTEDGDPPQPRERLEVSAHLAEERLGLTLWAAVAGFADN